MGMVGKMCYGEGAEERRSATVGALEQLGCGRGWTAEVASDLTGYVLRGDTGLKPMAELDKAHPMQL
jgi:hypothetical protein